jgi:hypothetical protein
MGAVYRVQPDRRLEPDATHLRSPGRQLLMTRYGPLDLLGTIGQERFGRSRFRRTTLPNRDCKGAAVASLSLRKTAQLFDAATPLAHRQIKTNACIRLIRVYPCSSVAILPFPLP